MNKNKVCAILKIIIVVLIIFLSAYEIRITKEESIVEKKELKSNTTVKKEEIKVEEKQEEVEVQEEKTEEVPVTNNNNNITEQQVQNSVYTRNSIRINNILNNNLMKDEDGSHFYLNHNIYGVYDGKGVPYIDFRTDFTTRKTIIYSHSTTAGDGPFQALQNYHNNKEFYDNNRYIEIEYEGNKYTYLIFSVYISTAENEESDGLEYFHRMNYSDASWNERINYYKTKSEYDTGVEVNGSDKIVILQTCSMDPAYYEKYYRYNLLVMGKLV